jgi:hypothetical protein
VSPGRKSIFPLAKDASAIAPNSGPPSLKWSTSPSLRNNKPGGCPALQYVI